LLKPAMLRAVPSHSGRRLATAAAVSKALDEAERSIRD
jgi:hypothetical protein